MSKKVVRKYFSCLACPCLPIPNGNGGRWDSWCGHFMRVHLKKYEENYICPVENCEAKYMLLYDAVVHYKKKHLDFYSICMRCMKEFPTVEMGRLHDTEGCGDFIVCKFCGDSFYGEQEIQNHTNGGCRLGINGNGEHDEDNEAETQYIKLRIYGECKELEKKFSAFHFYSYCESFF